MPPAVVEASAMLVKLMAKYPDVVTHVVSFVRALFEGDKLAASRAATSALVSRFWRRARA